MKTERSQCRKHRYSTTNVKLLILRQAALLYDHTLPLNMRYSCIPTCTCTMHIFTGKNPVLSNTHPTARGVSI